MFGASILARAHDKRIEVQGGEEIALKQAISH